MSGNQTRPSSKNYCTSAKSARRFFLYLPCPIHANVGPANTWSSFLRTLSIQPAGGTTCATNWLRAWLRATRSGLNCEPRRPRTRYRRSGVAQQPGGERWAHRRYRRGNAWLRPPGRDGGMDGQDPVPGRSGVVLFVVFLVLGPRPPSLQAARRQIIRTSRCQRETNFLWRNIRLGQAWRMCRDRQTPDGPGPTEGCPSATKAHQKMGWKRGDLRLPSSRA
jgi:hypothetical protein